MTAAQRNAASAAAVLAVIGGLAYGLLAPSVDPTRLHSTVTPDGGSPPGAVATLYSVRGSTAALALFGVVLPDGGSGYALARVCAVLGEASEGPQLPPGIDVLPGSEQEGGDCAVGGPVVEVWAAESAEAPFLCACGPGCIQHLPASPFGPAVDRSWDVAGRNVLAAGQWTAPDAGTCRRVPCTVFAGAPFAPPECQ